MGYQTREKKGEENISMEEKMAGEKVSKKTLYDKLDASLKNRHQEGLMTWEEVEKFVAATKIKGWVGERLSLTVLRTESTEGFIGKLEARIIDPERIE